MTRNDNIIGQMPDAVEVEPLPKENLASFVSQMPSVDNYYQQNKPSFPAQHMTDDNKARIVNSISYANGLNIPLDQADRQHDAIKKVSEEDPTIGQFFSGIKDAWVEKYNQGYSDINEGLWYHELSKNFGNQDAWNAIAEINKQRPEQQAPDNYPEKMVGSAGQLAPFMIEGFRYGAERGAIMGGGAALISASSGLGLPATIPLAASMYGVGQISGSAEFAYKVESGLALKEMFDYRDPETGGRIDPNIARAASLGIGVLNAAIETSQIGLLIKTIPGGEALFGKAISDVVQDLAKKKTFNNLLARFVKRHGTFVGLESLQEVAQESVTIAGTELAKEVTDRLKGTELEGVTPEEVGERIRETFITSAEGFALLGLPGNTVSSYLDGKTDFDQQAAPEQEVQEEQQFEIADPENTGKYDVTDEEIQAQIANKSVIATDEELEEFEGASEIRQREMATSWLGRTRYNEFKSVVESVDGEEKADAVMELLETRAQAMGYDSAEDMLVSENIRITKSNLADFDAEGALQQPAFHGTPHRGIEQFSTDFIGTGEGAQAFGYGLYFAGKKEVAEFYREKLSKSGNYTDLGQKMEAITLDGQKIWGKIDIEHDDEFYRLASENDQEGIRQHATRKEARWRELSKDDSYEFTEYAAKKADAWWGILNAVNSGKDVLTDDKGQVYRAEIPEDSSMLQWDKNISEQPQEVRQAIEQNLPEWSEIDVPAGEFYANLAGKIGKKETSDFLYSLGIKGMKYLDGTSRGQGDGSFNYVIFDGADTKILETYYQDQGTTKGAVVFNDTQKIIHLFESADVSTIVHELSHIWRRDLSKEDLAIAEKWAGVRDGKWTREQEEMFARGFEKYLREGKSPDAEIQGLFDKFKDWLTEIYKVIRGSQIDVEIDEVRGVFDRLLIEQNETTETTGEETLFQRENTRPWPDDFPNVITHTTLKKLKSHKDYKQAKAGDAQSAVGVVRDTIKPEKIKQLVNSYPDATVVFPHAEEESGRNAIPAAYAVAIKDFGLDIDYGIIQNNKPARTKKGSVLRLVLRPTFSGQVKKGSKYILVDDAVGQGGTFAELRHFIENNGGEVVATSSLTSGIFSSKLSINKETVSKLREKFGNAELTTFLQEENIAGSIEALTEKEARFILKQSSINALRNRILAEAQEGTYRPDEWRVRRPSEVDPPEVLFQSEETVFSKLLKGIAPEPSPTSRAFEAIDRDQFSDFDQFMYALKKAAIVARRAKTEGKKEGKTAEHARMRAIIDRANLRRRQQGNRRELKARIKRLVSSGAKITNKRSKVGADPQEYFALLNSALNSSAYNLQVKIAKNIDILNNQVTNQEEVEAQEKATLQNNIYDIALDFGTMDTAALYELYNMLVAFKGSSMLSWQEEYNKFIARVDAARSSVINTVGHPDDGYMTSGIGRSKGVVADAKKRLKTLGISFMGWNDLVDILSSNDGQKPGEGPLSKVLVDTIYEAQNVEKDGIRNKTQAVTSAVKEIYNLKNDYQVHRLLGQYNKEIDLGEFENRYGYTVPLKMSKGEMMQRLMELAQPSLEINFMVDMGYTDEIVRAIRDQMTPQDEEMIRWFMADYDQNYTRINAVYRRVYGVNLPRVKNYAPIKVAGSGAAEDAGSLTSEFLTETSYRMLPTSGSLKGRQSHHHRIEERNAFSVWQQHNIEMEHFISHIEPVRFLNAVLLHGDVKTAIRDKFGPEMNRMLDSFLRDFARGGADKAQNFNALDVFRGNITRSVLAIKPSIGIKQLTSAPAYFDAVPWKDVPKMMYYMAEFWIFPVKNFKFLKEHSTMFATRGDNTERDIKAADQTPLIKGFTANPTFNNWLMLNIKLGDQGAIAWGGWALYKTLRSNGMSHEEAIKKFEAVTKQTQQSSDISEQSFWQRGNSFAKLFTMFQSSINQYMRKEIGAIRNRALGRISTAEMAKTIMVYHFLLPMMFQLASDRFEWEEDEQLRAAILGPLNGFFIVGQGLDTIIRAALGMHVFDLTLPIFAPFKDLEKVMRTIAKDGDLSAEDFFRIIKSSMSIGGAVTGLPGKYAADAGKAVVDAAAGEWKKAATEALGYGSYKAEVLARD